MVPALDLTFSVGQAAEIASYLKSGGLGSKGQGMRESHDEKRVGGRTMIKATPRAMFEKVVHRVEAKEESETLIEE